jgi:sigma-E factor negative regulatory protein RseA
MDKMDNQELISALADGELRGAEFARGVAAVATDARGRATWQSYQVIGEVLRSGAAPVGTTQEVFLARMQQRLAQEAPLARPVAPAIEVRAGAAAANDGRWKLAAGLASVAAVAALGWNVWGTAGVASGPQLAAVPAGVVPVAAQARASAMIRDPRLDQLLAAHRQFGGATALQTPTGFLRNATFEGPAR